MDEYVNMAKRGLKRFDEIASVPTACAVWSRPAKLDLEDWMDGLKLDAVLFPTVADVAPADADVNPASRRYRLEQSASGLPTAPAIRHLGVPTVTVPMGVMADIGMPVGLTFAGRAYDDNNLLRVASAFESTGSKRQVPPRRRRWGDYGLV